MHNLILAALILVWPVAAQPSAQTFSVNIEGDAAQCAASSSVQLWTIRTGFPRSASDGPREGIVAMPDVVTFTNGPVAVFASFVDGQKAGETCRWTFPSVAAGDYVAFLSRPDGSGGSQRFSVSGANQTVAIPAPRVQLMGRLVRNGQPIPGLLLRVTGLPFARPAVTASTDADGRYTLTLDRPGLHQIDVDRFGTFDVTLAEDTNHLEHDLAQMNLVRPH